MMLIRLRGLLRLCVTHTTIQCAAFIILNLFCFTLYPAIPKAEVSTKESSKQAEHPEKEITKNKDRRIEFDPLNDSSEEEIILFQELAKRSQEISAREENLKQQTLILKASEISMGEKLKHFDLLKQDLLKMLDKLKEKEEKQVDDLVKIYAVMKPKQAASILNQMDMAILKEIVKRMTKKKAALIMAAMDAKKAKDLTQHLAKESQNIG